MLTNSKISFIHSFIISFFLSFQFQSTRSTMLDKPDLIKNSQPSLSNSSFKELSQFTEYARYNVSNISTQYISITIIDTGMAWWWSPSTATHINIGPTCGFKFTLNDNSHHRTAFHGLASSMLEQNLTMPRRLKICLALIDGRTFCLPACYLGKCTATLESNP